MRILLVLLFLDLLQNGLCLLDLFFHLELLDDLESRLREETGDFLDLSTVLLLRL
jgi:hypothetical protein